MIKYLHAREQGAGITVLREDMHTSGHVAAAAEDGISTGHQGHVRGSVDWNGGTLKGWKEATAEQMANGGTPSSHHASDMGDASSSIISKIAYVVLCCTILETLAVKPRALVSSTKGSSSFHKPKESAMESSAIPRDFQPGLQLRKKKRGR